MQLTVCQATALVVAIGGGCGGGERDPASRVELTHPGGVVHLRSARAQKQGDGIELWMSDGRMRCGRTQPEVGGQTLVMLDLERRLDRQGGLSWTVDSATAIGPTVEELLLDRADGSVKVTGSSREGGTTVVRLEVTIGVLRFEGTAEAINCAGSADPAVVSKASIDVAGQRRPLISAAVTTGPGGGETIRLSTGPFDCTSGRGEVVLELSLPPPPPPAPDPVDAGAPVASDDDATRPRRRVVVIDETALVGDPDPSAALDGDWFADRIVGGAGTLVARRAGEALELAGEANLDGYRVQIDGTIDAKLCP